MTEGDKFSKIRTILSVLFLLVTIIVSAYTFYYFNKKFNKMDDQFAAQNLLIHEQSQNIKDQSQKIQEQSQNIKDQSQKIQEQSQNIKDQSQKIQEQSQKIQELGNKVQEGGRNSGGLFGQLGLDKVAETFTNMNPVTKGAEAFSKVAGTATDSINKLQQGAKKN